MKVVLAGASGLVGSQILQDLFNSPQVTSVVTWVRRRLPLHNPKLTQVEFQNFSELPTRFASLPAASQDAHRGAVFICALGTTLKTAGSQKAFFRVDHDGVLAFGQLAVATGSAGFILVSAKGANPKSAIFYNRVKGQAEQALQKLALPRLVFFRPGLLLGKRPSSQAPRFAEHWAIRSVEGLRRILGSTDSSWGYRWTQSFATDAAMLAQAIVRQAIQIALPSSASSASSPTVFEAQNIATAFKPLAALGVWASLLATTSAQAWIFPEHRELAAQGIRRLSETHRQQLQTYWQTLRIGYEGRLAEQVVRPQSEADRLGKRLIDFADFPAIAGDHSVSPQDLWKTVSESEWIPEVVQISDQLRHDLAQSASPFERVNALRESDIKFQRADPDYATRAGSNNAHFLVSLSEPEETLESYIARSVNPATEINALSIYLHLHDSAKQKLAWAQSPRCSPEQKATLIRASAIEEAFALHFLQDMTSAGHTVGTWGNSSQRKGTHDFFNEHGLQVTTWNGRSHVLMGDAWMEPADIEIGAELMRASLAEWLDTPAQKSSDAKQACPGAGPSGFSVRDSVQPPAASIRPALLKSLPIPGLHEGKGEIPRFRAELGPFFGLSAVARMTHIRGGFANNQSTPGWVPGLETTVRVGVGLDGILNESSDGLAFLGLGYRQDGTSSQSIVNGADGSAYGNLIAAVPARAGFSARLRAPFYIIPGDLLLLAPFLAWAAPHTLEHMAVVAANGGLLPWQSGIATPVGRFQFVLGREVAVYFFGRQGVKDAVLASTSSGGSTSTFIYSYQSNQYEFPFLEYRPTRSFQTDQSSTFLLQFYAGIDDPHTIKLQTRSGSLDEPGFKSIGYVGARLIFDWRHYFP